MIEKLTLNDFKTKVFDFTKQKDWQYSGVPLILDFYADWCQPCKRIAPVLEQLQKEYGTKIKIHKIDTEQEQELSAMFGIRSIPSLLFIPSSETPQMVNGAVPKDVLEDIIAKVLKVSK